MDFDDLRCFVAVARHLSFRRGAREVGLSPTALSERVARLEAGLGTQLFARTTRRVALTAAGERLLPKVQHVLLLVSDLADVTRDDSRPVPYALTIGTRFELGNSWLLPVSCALRADHPERTIHLRFGDSAALIDELLAGTLDAVVTSLRLGKPGLDYAPLHQERYVLVAAPTLLARHPLRGPADAAAHTLIDTLEDLPLFRYFHDASSTHASYHFAKIWLLGAIGAIHARVLAGDGVAVLPRYLVQTDLVAGRLCAPVDDIEPASDFFRLVWRRDDPRAPRWRSLAGELAQHPLR